MRSSVPPAVDISFTGPEGPYTVCFRPTGEWDGVINVTIGNQAMQWTVDDADRQADGATVLGGMTNGSQELWGDQFWFELRLADNPTVMRYWADKVIWREDKATQA